MNSKATFFLRNFDFTSGKSFLLLESGYPQPDSIAKMLLQSAAPSDGHISLGVRCPGWLMFDTSSNIIMVTAPHYSANIQSKRVIVQQGSKLEHTAPAAITEEESSKVVPLVMR